MSEDLIPEITVADALRRLGKDDIPETATLRGYVLLAEWEDWEGEWFKTLDTAPGQSDTITNGLLFNALHPGPEEDDE